MHRSCEAQLANWVKQVREDDHYQNLSYHHLPLQINLSDPSSVGMDRLVAAVGANLLRSDKRPAIVVDGGTAITVNLIAGDGAFVGGAILPGFRMAARSLAVDTDALPEVDVGFDDETPVVGTSTVAALRGGLLWGTVGGVCEIVRRMTRSLGQTPQMFVTGGNAELLAAHLGQEASWIPDLVLTGIVATAEQEWDTSTE